MACRLSPIPTRMSISLICLLRVVYNAITISFREFHFRSHIAGAISLRISEEFLLKIQKTHKIDFGTRAVLYCSATSESMKNRRALPFLVGSFDTRYSFNRVIACTIPCAASTKDVRFSFTSPSIFSATRKELACISELSLASSRVE